MQQRRPLTWNDPTRSTSVPWPWSMFDEDYMDMDYGLLYGYLL
jgi:hypothetical protein